MSKDARIIENLERYQKLFKKRAELPSANFWKMLSIAHHIFMVTNQSIGSDPGIDTPKGRRENIISQSAKNLIINIVTATEVFLRDLVKTICDKHVNFLGPNGLDELLKEKISLRNAYILFRDKEVTSGDLIASAFLFESIVDINDILSKLIGKNFLNEIEKLEFDLDDAESQILKVKKLCLERDFPKWREIISKIFRVRHDSIHHLNFSDLLSQKEIYEILDPLIAFIVVTGKQYLC